MDRSHIAAQLYTVRELMKTEEDIRRTLKLIRGIGYEAVQLSGLGPIDPQVLKGICDDLGLCICATHVGYDLLRHDLAQTISDHKIWNCRYVGVGSISPGYPKTIEGYTRYAKDMNAAGSELRRNGLVLIYHNHHFEFEKLDGRTALEILLAETDPGSVDFEIDTYWVQAGGGSPVSWLKKVEGRMDVVHFKDMAIYDQQQTICEIGTGNLDWPSIIDTCRNIGVKWYCIEQDSCRGGDPIASLAMSWNYLQQYL
jgi:sugar phosphate isomerase/epimerase